MAGLTSYFIGKKLIDKWVFRSVMNKPEIKGKIKDLTERAEKVRKEMEDLVAEQEAFLKTDWKTEVDDTTVDYMCEHKDCFDALIENLLFDRYIDKDDADALKKWEKLINKRTFDSQADLDNHIKEKH